MNTLFVTHSASSHHKLMELYATISENLIILSNAKNKPNLDYEFPKVKQKNKITNYQFYGILDAIKKAKQITKEKKIDIVISHCPISGFIASRTNKKHIFVMCQDFIEYLEASNINPASKAAKKAALKFLLKRSFKDANVVALSRHIEKRARSYGATKVVNIPIYGIDTNLFKKKAKDNILLKELGLKNKKTILTVTRLTPEKGTEFLIKAMKQIREQADAKLIIAGKGYEEKRLKKMAEELGLTNDVKFIGFKEYREMPLYYNLCDVFVLPSIKEGLGFASGEAMACEKPVVASNVGGIPDIVINEKTGLTVEPGDTNGIAKAVTRLLNNQKLAKRLVQEGKKHVTENFEENKLNERFKSFVKNGN